MNYDKPLKTRVDALRTPVILSTKSEIVAHYQKTTSGGSWRKELSTAFLEAKGIRPPVVKSTTPAGIKEFTAEQKAYEKKLHNAERNFDPSRLEKKTSGKNAEVFKKLSNEIGEVGTRAPKGYQIYFVVDIKISGKCGNIRSHTETLTGSAAYDFSLNPSWDTLMMLYFKGSVAENICKVYWDETTITPIE